MTGNLNGPWILYKHHENSTSSNMRSLAAARGIFLALCQSEPTDDSLCPYKASGHTSTVITLQSLQNRETQIRPKGGFERQETFLSFFYWTF